MRTGRDPSGRRQIRADPLATATTVVPQKLPSSLLSRPGCRLAAAIMLFCGATASLFAGSTGPPIRFHLGITYRSSVPGDVMTYTATAEALVVTYEDAGGNRRELLRSKLTGEQARRLHARMKSLPMDSIRPEPTRDDVEDGFEVRFRIQIDHRQEKQITMKNAWHPDLRKLCIELNRMLPEALRIKVPQDDEALTRS